MKRNPNGLAGPLATPINYRPLARKVTEAGRGGFKGFFKTAFKPEMTVLPIGTAAINESAAAGTTSRTLSVDTVETFYGRPTTKLVVTGAGTSNFVEVGVSTASINLGADARELLTRNMFVAVKTDGANTPTSVSVYLGDGSYANFRTVQAYFPDILPNGWRVFERIEDSTLYTSTTGTPPALTSAQRGKMRIVMNANVAAGTVWVGLCAVTPTVRPTVVFTVDDGYDEWTWLAAEAKARNIPVSFGISTDDVGTAGFLTQSEIVAIGSDPSGLFEITNHARTNTTYTTLGLSAYAAAVDHCRDYIVGLGLDPYAARLHAYVQGDYNDALIDELQTRGYNSCRGVGARNVSTRSALIAAGADKALFNIPVASYLETAENLALAKTRITNAASRGTAFICGHRFEGASSSTAWIAGYDANYGTLDLLDWLAQKRSTEGWRIMKWSDWAKQATAGAPIL